MMIRHDLSKILGQWRPGAIWVKREEDHELVYEAPDRELVPQLIGELASTLDTISDTDDHAVLRAAMAHLNLVMIHPFSDGNGRMARCLQTVERLTSDQSSPGLEHAERLGQFGEHLQVRPHEFDAVAQRRVLDAGLRQAEFEGAEPTRPAAHRRVAASLVSHAPGG